MRCRLEDLDFLMCFWNKSRLCRWFPPDCLGRWCENTNRITPTGQIRQMFCSSWAPWLLPTLIGIVAAAISCFLCGTLTRPTLLCFHRFTLLIPTIWSIYLFIFFRISTTHPFFWSVTAPALTSLTSSALVLKQIFVHQVQMLFCIHSASTPPPPLQSTRCR